MIIPAIHVSQARTLGTGGRLSHIGTDLSTETRFWEGASIPGQSYWLVGMAISRITSMTRLLKESVKEQFPPKAKAGR
jgi:hypothetical protein